jgi:iduronate 2-sulfatase
MFKRVIPCLWLFLAGSAPLFAESRGPSRLNVLLIIVDDLKPELNCYGESRAITPHIDRVASEGIAFLNAYCQKAICVPSRQSFLTGTRPNTFGAAFETRFRKKLPNVVTLPQQFGKNGYRTRGMGKVFHHRDDQSWDQPQWMPEPSLCYPVYMTDENLSVQRERIAKGQYHKRGDDWWARGGKWVPAGIWEAPDVDDDDLTDGKIARHAIQTLTELKDEPFFMAVGFCRPHIPFIAPKKYYDLYPLDKIELPAHPDLPQGVPAFAAEPGGEWRSYHNVATGGRMPGPMVQREYIRGYLASVSYADAQIGRVLDALASLGLADKTCVVIMGDHGYHLFDHHSFGKSTNFENATRVPLIVRWPGAQQAGSKVHAIVELVDLYPTLCDLAGLPIPEHTQGKSFKAVLAGQDRLGKQAAYSQFAKGGHQGYSVRTGRYRLTRWQRGSQTIFELYDHDSDPNETVNLARESDNQPIIEQLNAMLNTVFD